MCGIFAISNERTNNAAQTVLEGLKKLEYRGYDSWGVAIKLLHSQLLQIEKHVGKISKATTSLPQGKVAIGHTRWATHGGVTDANAHPHFDCSKRLAVLHNGIVENYQEIKAKLIEMGHKFISETDTEVVAHLIEEKMKKMDFQRAVLATFSLLAGSNAIAVLDGHSSTVVACRNGSPLVVGLSETSAYLASDVPAFLRFTNKVYFMNDGEAVILRDGLCTLCDAATGKVKKLTTQKLDWTVEDAEKKGYPHFLLKEIMEQPQTISKAAVLNSDSLSFLAEKIKNGAKIVMTGCGTASYCALAAKYFFAQKQIESQVYGAYEFLPFAKFCNQNTVFIAVSQSGETADTIIAAKAAKKRGAYVVAIVNARGSTLERLADLVLPTGAGPEIAVVSTKAFTSQLTILYALACTIAKRNIENLVQKLEHWLTPDLQKKIISLAKLLMEHEHIYLIGKHLNYPASLEFALKIKESSYTHAEPFAAGELKHGVITLIQKNTPCFVLAGNDEVKCEVLSSAAELKAMGADIIGIAPFSDKEFNELIETPDVGDLTLFPNVIVGQLLGYYMGIGKGADPDKPRNLAKSVTVK